MLKVVRFATVVALAVVISSVAMPASADDSPKAGTDVADQLFAEANRAIEQGDTELAYEKLRAAWQRKKSMDIAANLALIERALGKLADAALHLDYALRNFPPTGSSAVKQRMQADLETLRGRLGRLTIVVPPGTSVSVDGVEIEAVFRDGAIYVEPGTHRVVGKHAELGRDVATVEAPAGVVTEVRLTLASEVAGPGPTSDEAVPSEPLPLWPAILGLASGAAATALGVAFLVRSEAEADSASELGAGLSCDPAALSPACEELADTVERRNAFGNVAIGGFVAGGALLAMGAIWLGVALQDEPEPTSTAIVVRPAAGPHLQGFSIEGAFQ